MGKRWEGERWTDDYDYDLRDPHTRMFVAASNWMDRALIAERKLNMLPADKLSEMVDRFLRWPLPDSVCADLNATMQGVPHRSGTNLLTAIEARQMLEYLLASTDDESVQTTFPRPVIQMETMTQPKIAGYRQLNESEAALINAVKKSGEQLDALLTTISAYLENQATHPDPDEGLRLELAQPRRWLAIGHTDIQTGLMALVRAIAQPTTL